MRDSLRVVLFLAALVVVGAVAYGVGTRFDPVDPAPAPVHGSSDGSGNGSGTGESHDGHGGDR